MSESDNKEYKALYCQAAGRLRRPTLKELILASHDLLYNALKVQFACHYLQPLEDNPRQFFTLLAALEEYGRRVQNLPIGSEKDLEYYEQENMLDHVSDIIAALCRYPEAQQRFGLGNGVKFDNHANPLNEGHKTDYENCKPAQGTLTNGFWREVIEPNTIPTEGPEKSEYCAKLRTSSVAVQRYNVMIQEGRPNALVTNGLLDVYFWGALRGPYEGPGTRYYDVCDPCIDQESSRRFKVPRTRIERALCLCLMSFGFANRNQAWRNEAWHKLRTWPSNYDFARPSSSHAMQNMRCHPTSHSERIPRPPGISGPGSTIGRKRDYDQVIKGSVLDQNCPNTESHRQNNLNQDPLDASTLVRMIKEQLDKDLDHNLDPLDLCGAYNAPLKVTCATHGYTGQVSREAEFYRHLESVQGERVPVAGGIRHMLLMDWGGQDLSSANFEKSPLGHAVLEAAEVMRSLGIIHEDLRLKSILRNPERNCLFII
ncbi:uncharacterized protein BDV17DRAFT_282469 [Aspergillus undulatus]|uniref:uncharacterized protein n=1 Tax=Aspergillus undulatus TaxID=1810928 RepID=UPI003CCD092B